MQNLWCFENFHKPDSHHESDRTDFPDILKNFQLKFLEICVYMSIELDCRSLFKSQLTLYSRDLENLLYFLQKRKILKNYINNIFFSFNLNSNDCYESVKLKNQLLLESGKLHAPTAKKKKIKQKKKKKGRKEDKKWNGAGNPDEYVI